MKKLLLVLALLALSVNSALAISAIGLYADEAATACDAAFSTPYTYVDVYVLALMDPVEIPSISGAQFKVTGLPDGVAGIQTLTWNTPLVIGDNLGVDIALAFDPPLEAPMATMGTIQYFILSALGNDHLMVVAPADSQTEILLVDYATATEIGVAGGCFTYNCTAGCDNCCATPIEDKDWSSIKALY